MTYTKQTRYLSLLFGVITLAIFTVAVGEMILSLYDGMNNGHGTINPSVAPILNIALLLQFPLAHSLLLTPKGKKLLSMLPAGKAAGLLTPTTFVLVSALQLFATFYFWTPSHIVYWEPRDGALAIHQVLFAFSWLLLFKSMYDAHLSIQLGYIGWQSVWKNRAKIDWPSLPINGIYKICRQPIYFSFALTLWTSPLWTRDKIIVAIIWTFYSFLGAKHKEMRQLKTYGKEFNLYRQLIPFWPTPASICRNIFQKNYPLKR